MMLSLQKVGRIDGTAWATCTRYLRLAGLMVSLSLALPVSTFAAEARVIVSDFEQSSQALLDMGWSVNWKATDDRPQGGSSSSLTQVVSGGAENSDKSLRVSGSVTDKFRYAFAGVTGELSHKGGDVDVSGYTGVRFFARGDDEVYEFQVLSSRVTDANEFRVDFVATPTWRLYEIPFEELEQSPYYGTQYEWTGKDVRGLSFQTSEGPLARFHFEIDEVSFY